MSNIHIAPYILSFYDHHQMVKISANSYEISVKDLQHKRVFPFYVSPDKGQVASSAKRLIATGPGGTK